MQVRHVDLLCFASNFCFIGPENLEDERIVVFVHVACAQVPVYDGFTATDEVQFPLLMAEKSASLPTLQKKFMHLMAIRYHILCASNYDVHPMKRLPMPTYTKLRKILQRSSDIFDEMCTAIPNSTFLRDPPSGSTFYNETDLRVRGPFSSESGSVASG
jgi:hypothetical protein